MTQRSIYCENRRTTAFVPARAGTRQFTAGEDVLSVFGERCLSVLLAAFSHFKNTWFVMWERGMLFDICQSKRR